MKLGGSGSGDDGGQGADDSADRVGPLAGDALAEEDHAGIPGRIRAIQQPAEIGDSRNQLPDGFAHRAGEMGDGGVDGDDQISWARRSAVSAKSER